MQSRFVLDNATKSTFMWLMCMFVLVQIALMLIVDSYWPKYYIYIIYIIYIYIYVFLLLDTCEDMCYKHIYIMIYIYPFTGLAAPHNHFGLSRRSGPLFVLFALPISLFWTGTAEPFKERALWPFHFFADAGTRQGIQPLELTTWY